MKPEQTYASHRRLIPTYHFFIGFIIVACVIGALINLVRSITNHEVLYSASLIFAITVVMVFNFFFMRLFALRAQDRAIRAEENLRYFVLTGKLLPAAIHIHQVIALRFASDEEFVSLVDKAIKENMKPDEIKRSIKNWKGDFHRV